MPIAPTIKLSSGNSMPVLGLGTWKSEKGKVGEAVKAAIRAGYRMIDCANDYNNEPEIGDAIAELISAGEIKREELFIQCKLWNGNHKKEHVLPDLQASLEDLKLDYIDSFIIHWPQACPSTGSAPALRKNGARHDHMSKGVMFPVDDDGMYCSDNASHYIETWTAMEDLYERKLVRSIGLSNFTLTQIKEVLAVAKIKPALLQNESHPYLQQKDLIDFCRFHNIVFQAFSPLGSADRPWLTGGSISSGPPPVPGGFEVLEQPALKAIAAAHNKSTAQVVLRWHFQRGVATVPKSTTPKHVEANIDIFDFALTDEEMREFDALNVGWRHCIWAETSLHPDYPFKDELPYGYKPAKAPKSTTTSGK